MGVRAGLTIEEKTGQAMVGKAGEVLKLPGSRLLMEAQALFSYGAAAASLRLLWRYRLLDLLVPPLAERFTRRRLPRCECFSCSGARCGAICGPRRKYSGHNIFRLAFRVLWCLSALAALLKYAIIFQGESSASWSHIVN